MEIPEIQYQPEAPASAFNPVTTVDATAGMIANQQATSKDMNDRLQQMRRDAETKLQNVKNSAFPLEQLQDFSKTAQKMLGEQIESQKKDLENEMAMLAFTDGIETDPAFNANEKQLDSQGKAIEKTAGTYERKTGDVEGAERIRGMSGWRKYYYMKAKTEQAGKGFGAWMDANASNPDYAVNVGGQMYTLANAPDAPTRQAVAAKMVSSYMTPYQGLNKSFLSKYMFPGVQKGMSSTVANYAAKNAERIQANRIDAAKQDFLTSTDKGASMQAYRMERSSMGATEATIRSEMVEMAGQFQSKTQLDAFLDAPYGPNGKSFREQYPKEAQEATDSFFSLKQSVANNNEKERKIADTNELEAAKAQVALDRKDGSFDARPERLQELSEQAKANGYPETAKYWESQIAETAYMKNSKDVRKQYELQIAAGVIPSDDEVLQNPALSQKDKQAILQKGNSAGGAAPSSEVAKGHKKIIEASIRKRGKWSPTKANDPGVAAMELKAWQEYKEVYNRELQANGGNEAAAASAALSDFNSKFGSDQTQGPYALVQPDKDGKVPAGRLNTYAGYDPTGQESTAQSPAQQFNDKLKYTDANTAINTMPDLYVGEEQQLRSLSDSFATTGKIGTVPPLYYELQQRYGGNVSIMDLINKRLEANNMDKLPAELNQIIKPVQDTFDEETYKYISYKPNATRTDIGLINSGVDPVYRASIPNSVASDPEFQSEVSSVAGRLGVSEADLYAVMSFETGGTFNPNIRNAAGSGATGLIQFMPSTAQGLGTSTDALAGMSRVQQMKYVEKYLKNAGVKPGANLSDLYMAVLFPAAVGKSDDFVLFGNGAMSGFTGRAYDQNRGLDKNGDGSITKAEASAKVLAHREPPNSAQPWRQPKNVRPELQ